MESLTNFVAWMKRSSQKKYKFVGSAHYANFRRQATAVDGSRYPQPLDKTYPVPTFGSLLLRQSLCSYSLQVPLAHAIVLFLLLLRIG